MLWKRPWGWLVMAVANLAPLVIHAAEASRPPFQVTWTAGACANCQTARGLGYVRFVDGADAWALGFNPPGETGFGDWTIVHTGDGGRTWRELPHSYEHNDPPSVSFASARYGWVMVADMTTAEERLMATTDGGAHWRRLPLRDLFVQAMPSCGRPMAEVNGRPR